MTFSCPVVPVSMHKMAYKRVRDVCLEPQLPNVSSDAVLTKKIIISDSRAVMWCANRSHILCTFELCMREKERKKEWKKKKNITEIFTFFSQFRE